MKNIYLLLILGLLYQSFSAVAQSTSNTENQNTKLLLGQPTVSPQEACQGENVILVATAAEAGDLLFYDNTGTLVATVPVNNANPTGTYNAGMLAIGNHIYFVSLDNGTVESDQAAIPITVYSNPVAPSAAGAAICQEGSVTLEVTSGSGNYNWYTEAGLINLVNTGTIFTTPNLNTTTSYWVAKEQNGCQSTGTQVTVTVTPNPPTPNGMGATICSGESAVISAMVSGGTTTWYSVALGTNPLANGPTYTTPILTQTTSFFVIEDDGTCRSDPEEVTVTVRQLPTTPSTSDAFACQGEDVILRATGDGDGDLNFYDNSNTLEATYTMSAAAPTANINIGTYLPGSYTYYVAKDDGNCESERAAISVTVISRPTAPTAAGTTICAGESTVLSAFSNGTIIWYADAALTTPVQVGATYQTPVLTANTNYYVTQRDFDTGCSSDATTVPVTVTPNPSDPVANGVTICAGTRALLITTTSGGTTRWFSDANGSTLQTAGTTFITPTLTQSTTFYVQEFDGNCKSNFVSVKVTVIPNPNAPSAPAVNACFGDDAILSPTGSGNGDLIFYDNTNTQVGTYTMSAAAPTGSYNAGALAPGSYTFYVTENDGNCESQPVAVNVTIFAQPGAPTAAGTTICSGESATLTTASSGTTIWYADAALTATLQVGASYQTPSLTTTTNYYVTQLVNGCESNATTVMVTVLPKPPAPTANGVTACSGESATLTASTSGGTTNWYSDANGSNLLATGTTFITATLTQSTTFYVQESDGNCESNFASVKVTVRPNPNAPSAPAVNACAGDVVTISATGTGNGTLTFYNNTNTQVGTYTMSAAAPTGTVSAGTFPTGNYTFYVTENDGNCESQPVAVNVTIFAEPSAPTATGTTICSGESATLSATASGTKIWYEDAALTSPLQVGATYVTPILTANTNFYVTTTVNGCESDATAVTVTVAPNPTNPTASGVTACSGESATLTANTSGGTTNWYSDANGSNLLAIGTTFNTATLTQSTTFYVQESDGNCESEFVGVKVTIIPNPNAPSAPAVNACFGDDAIISATGSGSGDLIFYNNTNTQVDTYTMSSAAPTGTYNAGALTTGNYTFYVTEYDGNCESQKVAVNVTVYALPPAPTAAGTTINAGQSATLTASSSGTTISWYTTPALTTAVQVGATFVTPNLTVTTNYYVTQTVNGCESPATTVTVTVNANTAEPVAVDDAVSGMKDTPITIDVTANDSDPDGNLDPSSVSITTPPLNGTAIVNPDGSVTYSPDANYSGTDSFSYTVCDLDGLCDSAEVVVTVTTDPSFSISGQVNNCGGNNMSQVEMTLSGDVNLLSTTDLIGNFQFNDIETGNYTLTPRNLNSNASQGLSVLDLISIQRHIQGDLSLTDPCQLIAADVNRSCGLSVVDIIQIKRIIQGETNSFPSGDAWRFVPTDFVFPLGQFPCGFPESIEYLPLLQDEGGQGFIGIKLGDVNGSGY